MSTQITGTITDVLMEEGESVVAGQVLTRLENSAQSAAVSAAEAQVKVARSLLGLYEAQMEQARRDLKRQQDLVKVALVSTQAVETALTQVEMLRSQIESQQRQVELADARVEAAQVQLDRTILRAPFSGVVIAKTAQAGGPWMGSWEKDMVGVGRFRLLIASFLTTFQLWDETSVRQSAHRLHWPVRRSRAGPTMGIG